MNQLKLDGVGPVDNRPSTDKLLHFVQKKEEKRKEKKSDMWRVTRYTWRMTCLGGEHSLKISAP